MCKYMRVYYTQCLYVNKLKIQLLPYHYPKGTEELGKLETAEALLGIRHTKKANSLGIGSLKTNQSHPFGTKSQDGKLNQKKDSYSYGLSREETQISHLEADLSKRNPTKPTTGETQGNNQYP